MRTSLQALGEVRCGLFYDGQLLGLLRQLPLEACVFYKKPFFNGAAILCKTSLASPGIQLAFMEPQLPGCCRNPTFSAKDSDSALYCCEYLCLVLPDLAFVVIEHLR